MPRVKGVQMQCASRFTAYSIPHMFHSILTYAPLGSALVITALRYPMATRIKGTSATYMNLSGARKCRLKLRYVTF